MLNLQNVDPITRDMIIASRASNIMDDPTLVLLNIPGVIWHNDTLYAVDDNGKKTKVADFILIPVEVIMYDDDNNQPLYYSIIGLCRRMSVMQSLNNPSGDNGDSRLIIRMAGQKI